MLSSAGKWKEIQEAALCPLTTTIWGIPTLLPPTNGGCQLLHRGPSTEPKLTKLNLALAADATIPPQTTDWCDLASVPKNGAKKPKGSLW